MDLLEQTKKLCKLYNIIPARSKGQNFLIKEEIYDEIIAAADLGSSDVVLEVGPGLGYLTAKLAARAGRVIAVELDDKLAGVLKTGLVAKGVKNVEVVNEDILKTPLAPFIKGEYKVVANLPYNITSIFLRKYLEMAARPEFMVLMLQKEVAERITARPGKMSLLSVSVQFYARPEIIKFVPKEFFWPRPEVDSAIVKIMLHKTPSPRPPRLGEAGCSSGEAGLNSPCQGGVSLEKEFFRLVKFGFSAKRKMLKNNLAAGFNINQIETAGKIKQAGFNEKIRAQELSVEDWLKLLTVFK